MGYSGARGTLINEKNLKSKISCQTPFKKRAFAVAFHFHLYPSQQGSIRTIFCMNFTLQNLSTDVPNTANPP